MAIEFPFGLSLGVWYQKFSPFLPACHSLLAYKGSTLYQVLLTWLAASGCIWLLKSTVCSLARLSDSVPRCRWLKQDVSTASRLPSKTSTQRCTVFWLTRTSGTQGRGSTSSTPLKQVSSIQHFLCALWPCQTKSDAFTEETSLAPRLHPLTRK